MAFASSVNLPPRSESPMPKHSGLRSDTPLRKLSTRSQTREHRARSLVRGRSEQQPCRASMAMASPAKEADCFSTLGLAPSASAAEIRQAYRSLAKKHHPDVDPSAGSCKFVDIRSAYELCLQKEAKRAQGVPVSSPLSGVRKANAATTSNSPVRASTRRSQGVRRDAWDDIWDEMLASPKASRRRR